MVKSGLLALLLGLMLSAPPLVGAAALQQIPLPAELNAGLEHLLTQVGPSSPQGFDPARIEALLGFVLADKQPGQLHVLAKREGATAAYYQFDLRGDLERLLRYTVNPHIPGHLFMPSSVRRVRWQALDGEGAMPQLSELLANLQGPKLVRGEAYLQGMTREDLEALLGLETLKCLLGKDCIDPILVAAQ